MALNLYPQPTGYDPRFGGVPGALGLPDPSADLAAHYPNLSGATSQASADVLAKLRGELSPETQNAIQDAAARFGVTSGMPGFTPGSLAGNRGLRDIGLNAEAQTQQGLQDYNALTSNISNTQTVNPALQASIAEQNAINASAPNPAAAQTYAQSLFDKYLAQIHGGGGRGGVNSPPIRAGGGGGISPVPAYVDPNTNQPAQHGTLSTAPTYGDMGTYNPFTEPAPLSFGTGSMANWYDANPGTMNPFGASPGPVYDNGMGNSGYITPLDPETWAQYA
jgi:hypothetical protein